jgi:hypothetical protein
LNTGVTFVNFHSVGNILVDNERLKSLHRGYFKIDEASYYLLANCIIIPHQSGFTRGDSAINQLLFITNEFGEALDEGKEIRVVLMKD